MKRLHLIVLGILFLLFFTIFSRSVKQGGMKTLDFTVTVKVQDHVKIPGDVMEGALFLASPLFSIIVIIFLTVITVIKRKKNRLAALIIPLAFGLMTMAEIYGKTIVHHPAPPFFLLKNPTTLFPKYHIWENFSYPSGHAARVVFLACTVFFTMKRRVFTSAGLGLGIVLISAILIYSGKHWLSDVVGGGLLGAGTGLLTSMLFLSYNKKRHETVVLP